MSLLQTLEADFAKILTALKLVSPVVAIVDPSPEAAIAVASAIKDATIANTITAGLQSFISTTQAEATAAGAPFSHADLVAKVTNAISNVSAALVPEGGMTGATNDHVQALASLVNTAVTISGVAA